ncbi:unnamed protein product [Bemisia tabaci]|uniref:Metalloendopeptidase n=1 Tax=Bemisia tabaci TaxID=7038 RepID=A0A9P0FZD5_BEMTA|nr:unnamed protein product [Bemisia tabaci]
MSEYAEKTCVRFKERSGERDYVRFSEDRNMRGAEADVGRGKGETIIKFNTKSWSRSMVLHELGHTLSLIDEHMRPDRDEYLKVYPKNALKEFRWVFEKFDYKDVNLLGEPFDRKSIMMYEMGYTWKGSKQKPSWPVDVYCSFDEEECGFKWWRGSTWKLITKTEDEGGYLESAISNIRGSPTKENPNIWSVNFHGLSPFDTERGPEGCIKFKYLLEDQIPTQVSLKLFKVDLRAPLDLFPKSRNYFEIWSTDASSYLGVWSQVSIRTSVTGPFMLEFRSSFVDKNTKGSVKIDDLEVRYTPCKRPTHVDDQLINGKLSKQRTLSWLGSMKKLLPCSSSLSGSSFSSRMSSPTPSFKKERDES